MSEKRRGLGRGLGALIPGAPPVARGGLPLESRRPRDVFFPHREAEHEDRGSADGRHSDGGREDGSRSGSTWNTRDIDVRTPVDGANPTALVPVPGARFVELPLEQVVPNPRQPRAAFDPEALSELAASIREVGVLQPVVVRPAAAADGPGRFELVMGERRWRASREAGVATIPAIVRETGDDDLLRDALLENLHRSDLNALEEAAAYQQLLDDFGCTHDELATRVGRSRPQISNTLRLLRLPPTVQRRVAAGVLSAGHARAILALDDASAMERLAERVVAEGLSVRATEEAVTVDDGIPPRRRHVRAGARHEALDELAGRLGDRWDTRVRIVIGRSRGRMTIEFASVDDLDRILGQVASGESARLG